MSHEQLWAPWRLDYVAGIPANSATEGKQPAPVREDCFLCRYLGQPQGDAENLVIGRGACTISVLNRYPYNNGHLLVAPQSHKADLTDLTSEELLECQQVLQQLLVKLRKIMHPDGFNVGLNLGRVAGAGLPGHLHWHIVPRWNGDTNFMPVLANVKVIPQSLTALYDLLQQEA